MAGVQLKLDTTQWQRLLAKFGNYPRLFRFFRALAVTIGWRDVREHFKLQEGPAGRWPLRAEATNKAYLAIYSGKRAPPAGYQRGMFKPGGALLVLSGQLSREFKVSNVRDTAGDGVTLYNPVKYAGFHDGGDDLMGASRKVPQRQFMWLSKGASELIARETLKKYLEGP